MTLNRLLDRAAHSPFGLLLLVGIVLSTVQLFVPNLPAPIPAVLYATGVACLTIGGGGVGLAAGRSDAEGLRHEAELNHERMLPPFRRMLAGYRDLALMQMDIAVSHTDLQATVQSNRIAWPPVDKAMSVITSDMNALIRYYDQAYDEWRALLPEEVAKIEEGVLPPRASEIDKT